MQSGPGVGCQPHAIAGIGWDLWVVEDDLEQQGLAREQPQRDCFGEDCLLEVRQVLALIWTVGS